MKAAEERKLALPPVWLSVFNNLVRAAAANDQPALFLLGNLLTKHGEREAGLKERFQLNLWLTVDRVLTAIFRCCRPPQLTGTCQRKSCSTRCRAQRSGAYAGFIPKLPLLIFRSVRSIQLHRSSPYVTALFSVFPLRLTRSGQHRSASSGCRDARCKRFVVHLTQLD